MSISILHTIFYMVIIISTLASVVRAGHKTGDAVELTIISICTITTAFVVGAYVVPPAAEFTLAYGAAVSSAVEYSILYVGSFGLACLFTVGIAAFTIGWSPKGLGPTGERCGCINRSSESDPYWLYCDTHSNLSGEVCCEEDCDGAANYSGYCDPCYVHPDRICPVCKDWGYDCFENGSCVEDDES